MTVEKWHGGKGSVYRKVDSDAFSKNWDKIFNSEYKVVHTNCGTPDCCGECDTADKPKNNSGPSS